MDGRSGRRPNDHIGECVVLYLTFFALTNDGLLPAFREEHSGDKVVQYYVGMYTASLMWSTQYRQLFVLYISTRKHW